MGSVYATDVKVDARTGISYYQANLADTDLIAGVVSVGADMYCFEKNSFELGFNAHFLFGYGTERFASFSQKYKESGSYALPYGNPSYSLFFFGPVMRYNFSEKISARVGLEYEPELAGNNSICFLLSGDYLLTDNFAVGIESRIGVSFDIGASASYRF